MIKKLLYLTITIIAVVYCYSLYNNINEEYDTPASIDAVRQMVRLNSMELTDEIVYCDTIDSIGVIYATEIRVIVSFDIETLNYKTDSGRVTLVMPEPQLNIFQTGKEQCLDTYHTDAMTELLINPEITSTQSIKIHQRIREHVDAEVKRRGYAERASEIAFSNLQKLFGAMNITLLRSNGNAQATEVETTKQTTDKNP